MSPSPAFWALVDGSRPDSDEPEAHALAIADRLVERGVDATLAFGRDFEEAMSALHTWELWGAAYLALGGCSDDAFEYLRAWLTGRGETMWALGAHDPEAAFIELLGETSDAVALGARLDRGEHLLYAAGRAHETLTGRWLPAPDRAPGSPAGQEWEEEALPFMFPSLYQVAPTRLGSDYEDMSARLAVFQKVSEGLDAAATGRHELAVDILRPIFEEPRQWSIVNSVQDSRTGVAYALGIGLMLRGDVDGAAETFRRVLDDIPSTDELRRGLAQVELARGELAAAAELLDPSSEASRFDRILTAKLWWRLGEVDRAVSRSLEELNRRSSADDHPWDVAGALLQAGHILVDSGLSEPAHRVVKAMKPLLKKASPDFDLVVEWRLLEASVERLRGRPEKALARISAITQASGYSEAAWHRELARTLRALGREPEAQTEYTTAISALDRAGERWEATALRNEGQG